VNVVLIVFEFRGLVACVPPQIS